MQQLLIDKQVQKTNFILLFKGIESNDYNLVKNILERDVDLNRYCNGGFTPLMYAAYQFNAPSILNLLLKKGANPKLKDKKGATALTYLLNGYVFFPCKKAGTDVFQNQLTLCNYQAQLLMTYERKWDWWENQKKLEALKIEIVDK